MRPKDRHLVERNEAEMMKYVRRVDIFPISKKVIDVKGAKHDSVTVVDRFHRHRAEECNFGLCEYPEHIADRIKRYIRISQRVDEEPMSFRILDALPRNKLAASK